MTNINEAFKSPFQHQLERTANQIRTTFITKYDTTCPKCNDHGYCVTNDGGSIGGCLKCNITYTSKSYKVNQITKGTKIISTARASIDNLTNYNNQKCGLPRNNHTSYHLFDEADGKFNPFKNL